MLQALKLLLRNSIAYGIANIALKLIPVFILPILTYNFGKDGLRVYDVSFVYTFLFASLIFISLDTSAAVFFFDEKKEKFDKKQVLSHALLLQVISVSINLSIVYLLKDEISGFIFPGDSSIENYWLAAMLIIPGYMLFNYGLSTLLWHDRKFYYFLICLLNTVLNIFTVVFVIHQFPGSLISLIYAQVFSYLISGIIVIYLVRREVLRNFVPLNYVLIQRLLWFGLPFAFTAFFTQLIPTIDRFFLLYFQFSNDLPQYILAVKIASFFTIATNAFLLAFTPYSLNKLNSDDAEKEISELFRFISIIAFSFVPIVLIFKDILIRFFADRSYHLSDEILPFVLFGWVFDLFTYFTMLGVYKSQKSKTMLLILILSFVIICALNILFVPVYGVFGAAISFTLTKLLVFVFTLFYLKQYFCIKIASRSFVFVFAISIFFSFLIYKINRYTYLLLLLPFLFVLFFYIKKNFQQLRLNRIFSLKG